MTLILSIWVLTNLSCPACGPFVQVQPQSDNKTGLALVQQASRALGDEATIRKYKVVASKGQLTRFEDDNEFALSTEAMVEYPSRARYVVTMETGQDKRRLVRVWFDGKYWEKENDAEPVEIKGDALKLSRDMLRVQRIVRLVDIPGYKGIKIVNLGETERGGTTFAGVRLVEANHQDITLLFDKESCLLKRVETIISGPDGQDHELWLIYDDYRTFKGIKFRNRSR
jgi:hypothetical protein